MNYELKRYAFGETIGKGFNLYINNFIPIIVVSLLCQIPEAGLTWVADQMGITQTDSAGRLFFVIVGLLFSVVATGFLSAFVIHLVSRKFLEDSPIGAVNKKSILSMILPIVGLSLIVGFITSLGMLACIVPGIIIGLMYSVSTEALVVEGCGVSEAMKRSKNLTQDKKGELFLLSVVTFLIAFAISLPFTEGVKLLRIDETWIKYFNFIANALTIPIQSCINVVIYFNLRIDKEGFNIEHLVQQFSFSNSTGTENAVEG